MWIFLGDNRWWRLLFKFLIKKFQKKIYTKVRDYTEISKTELRKKKVERNKQIN